MAAPIATTARIHSSSWRTSHYSRGANDEFRGRSASLRAPTKVIGCPRKGVAGAPKLCHARLRLQEDRRNLLGPAVSHLLLLTQGRLTRVFPGIMSRSRKAGAIAFWPTSVCVQLR